MREKQRCHLYRLWSFLVDALPVWGRKQGRKKSGTNLCAFLKRLARLIGKLLHKSSLSIVRLCSGRKACWKHENAPGKPPKSQRLDFRNCKGSIVWMTSLSLPTYCGRENWCQLCWHTYRISNCSPESLSGHMASTWGCCVSPKHRMKAV